MFGGVGEPGPQRVVEGGAQGDAPLPGGGQLAHHADGVGELAARGGREQGLAHALGELGAPLAAALPVDQPAHEDLGEVIGTGLRHDAPPQLLDEVEVEGHGRQLGGEPTGGGGGEAEEAPYGGGGGPGQARGAQSGGGRALAEGAGQHHGQ